MGQFSCFQWESNADLSIYTGVCGHVILLIQRYTVLDRKEDLKVRCTLQIMILKGSIMYNCLEIAIANVNQKLVLWVRIFYYGEFFC